MVMQCIIFFLIRAKHLPFLVPSSLKNGALLEDVGEHWRYSSRLAQRQCCLVLVSTHSLGCLQQAMPEESDFVSEMVFILKKEQDG